MSMSKFIEILLPTLFPTPFFYCEIVTKIGQNKNQGKDKHKVSLLI